MKEYLGDSVYAESTEEGFIMLTTEDGINVSNTIILDSEVYDSLVKFVNKTKGT